MIFTFRCPATDGLFTGHLIEANYPVGKAPEAIVCAEHPHLDCPRAYDVDLRTLQIMDDDPIRTAYNSPKFEAALQSQNRRPDPLTPKDKFEARHVRAATGRNYIGNDVSQLTAKEQRSIDRRDKNPEQTAQAAAGKPI